MLTANFHCVNKFEVFVVGFLFVSKSFGPQSVTFLQGNIIYKELKPSALCLVVASVLV